MAKRTIQIITRDGPRDVRAFINGVFAVHPEYRENPTITKPEWIVTHIPTGRSVAQVGYQQGRAIDLALYLDLMCGAVGVDWLFGEDPGQEQLRFLGAAVGHWRACHPVMGGVFQGPMPAPAQVEREPS